LTLRNCRNKLLHLMYFDRESGWEDITLAGESINENVSIIYLFTRLFTHSCKVSFCLSLIVLTQQHFKKEWILLISVKEKKKSFTKFVLPTSLIMHASAELKNCTSLHLSKNVCVFCFLNFIPFSLNLLLKWLFMIPHLANSECKNFFFQTLLSITHCQESISFFSVLFSPFCERN
jgi:hypothetical protein